MANPSRFQLSSANCGIRAMTDGKPYFANDPL